MTDLFNNEEKKTPVNKKGVKIIGLQVQGIRKLKAFEMRFNEVGLTKIMGKNKAGKSTVIDCLDILFRGFRQMPKDFINHDSEKGQIIGKVGDYTIKRVITEKTNRLEVTKCVDGVDLELKNAQTFLDTMTNELTFNPFPFLDKTPAEKVKFVMNLSGIDFSDINTKISDKESSRTLKGREISNLGTVEAIVLQDGETIEKVDISDLWKQKRAIEESNKGLRDDWREKCDIAERLAGKKLASKVFFQDMIGDIKQRIGYVKGDETNPISSLHDHADLLEYLSQLLEKAQDIYNEFPVEIEAEVIKEPKYALTEDLDQKLINADVINKRFDDYANYLGWVETKDNLQKEYDAFTQDIDKLRKEKKEMLKKAEIIKGLELRDEGLFYNDIFSENWSRSEGALISSKIWKVTNPSLKAIFIDSGEQYDNTSRKVLEDWAKENDIQAIITIVSEEPDSDTSNTSIFIEEGQIKEEK
jgi:hypothetical protein